MYCWVDMKKCEEVYGLMVYNALWFMGYGFMVYSYDLFSLTQWLTNAVAH